MRVQPLLKSLLVLALITGATIVALAPGAHSSDATGTFVVLYKGNAVPNDAGSVISKAGGTLLSSYSQIGVVIARSTDPAFRGRLLKDQLIEGASATSKFGVQLPDERTGGNDVPVTSRQATATTSRRCSGT